MRVDSTDRARRVSIINGYVIDVAGLSATTE